MRFGFSLASSFALCLALPGIAAGSLTWSNQKVRLTAKAGEKEVVAAFDFKNTGTTTVTILNIQSGCECTVAELPQRTYAPGEGGSIKATFSIGDRTGWHDKQLTVSTDDPSAPTVTLDLGVHIEELLMLSTKILRWKVGGSVEEQFVEVSATGQHRIAALDLKEIKPKDQARVRLVAVEPGTKYRMYVQPKASPQPQTVVVFLVARFEGGLEREATVAALTR